MPKRRRISLHAHLVKVVRGDTTTMCLLCEDRTLADFFDNWAYQIAKAGAFNTLRGYCLDVRVFIDFTLHIALLLGGITDVSIAKANELFEDYLVFGVNSQNELVREAARTLRHETVGGDTARRYITSVNKFLDASESFRLGVLEGERLGYIPPGRMSVFPQSFTFTSNAPQRVRQALRLGSWLAGCLAGGVKKIKFKGLKPRSKKSQLADTDEFGGDEEAFPLDKVVELIESTECVRDALLYSGAAAFGPRISELLTLQFRDVQPGAGDSSSKVLIIDPRSRMNELVRWLPASIVKTLSHKGRDTPETFLIEPFASHFWINYARYRQEISEYERRHPFAAAHRFVFRTINDHRPAVSSYQSLYERFREAAFKVTGRYYGFHSLRHMYGYYLVNFCPNPWQPGRFGLELKLVQKLMGHKDIKSTERYARQDAQMLRATISALNAMRMNKAGFNVSQVRIEYMEKLKVIIDGVLGGDRD